MPGLIIISRPRNETGSVHSSPQEYRTAREAIRLASSCRLPFPAKSRRSLRVDNVASTEIVVIGFVAQFDIMD